MPYNGSGTFTPETAPGYPAVSGTTIASEQFNRVVADLADGLSKVLPRDGQSAPTADLPMGTRKHTGVGDAAARTQYASAGQVQDGKLSLLSDVAGADTITATAPLGMNVYAAGQQFVFIAAGTNTGAVTLNVNSIGAKAVTKNGTTALVAGDIPSGGMAKVVYDGTRFQLMNATPQPLDADLTAIAALTTAAYGRALLQVDSEAAFKALVNLEPGVDVQPYDPDIPTVAASPAEMAAGTEAALRSMSPLLVAQAIAAQGSSTNYQVFTTPGANTWNKPASGTVALIRCWGGGGSGAKWSGLYAGGGGGGGYSEKWMLLSALGATETVTVGAGGAAVSGSNVAGNDGGNTIFGAHLTAYGGKGGGLPSAITGKGGNGGGPLSTSPMGEGEATNYTVGSLAMLNGVALKDIATDQSIGYAAGVSTGKSGTLWGGGGGSCLAGAASGAGGSSTYGGGGGAGQNGNGSGVGGSSIYGGAGGSSSFGVSGSGTEPGGGGAGSGSAQNSGAGGAGRCEIIVF